MKHLLPEGWPRPRGYSNGIQADGEQVFVAGMIGWNEKEEMADGFVAQLELALRNTIAVLAVAADRVAGEFYRTTLGAVSAMRRDNM